MYLNEDFISFSPPVFQERFLIGQVGFDLESIQKSQDLLSICDLETLINLFTFLTFIVTFFICLKYINLKPFKEKILFIFRTLFGLESINLRFGTIALVILFYNIYFMILKSIITNNIKTTKIILNTSEILEQKEDVLRSSKLLCWMSGENEIEMARSSAKGTFLNKIYTKKYFNYFTNDYTLCTFEKRPTISMLSFINKIFFILSELLMSATLSVVR